MRDIKFRAIFKGEWVDVPVGYKRLGIDRNTLSQFTGLKDKNGVDIYEGDIVKFKKQKRRVRVGTITFQGGAFRIAHNNWLPLLSTIPYVLVIGNVQQNPELLENNDE